ncbi:MAG: hypothetical protein ACR2IH_11935 [Pyrinomonadaceae bacterium]
MAKFTTSIRDAGEAELDDPPTRRSAGRALAVVFASLAVIASIAAAAFYFYWQNLKKTPAYSVALVVDAARRDDQGAVDQLIDTSAVVDSFMPQITAKAVDLYGRGLPPQTIARVSQVAEPVMLALKDRARTEIPPLIRRKTERFGRLPFVGMVIGADQYIDVTYKGDIALVKSKLPGHAFEVTMRRSGDRWTIVAVHDDDLAERIAKAVGQEFIAAANGDNTERAGERLGIKDLNQLLKNAEEALK